MFGIHIELEFDIRLVSFTNWTKMIRDQTRVELRDTLGLTPLNITNRQVENRYKIFKSENELEAIQSSGLSSIHFIYSLLCSWLLKLEHLVILSIDFILFDQNKVVRL